MQALKTLSVIQRSVDLIKELHNEKIDIEAIDKTDQNIFREIFGSGRTKGVFQFESGGMQDLLMKLRPDRLEDLIAANALYRPGPLALIPDYIDRKHGAKWEVPHPIMREVLEEKLTTILNEFGVDKTSDVLDSAETDHLFENLYIETLRNPDSLETEAQRLINTIREEADQANRACTASRRGR